MATFQIYQKRSESLTFPDSLTANEGCIELIENMIQSIKQNQYQRSSPLTLIFSKHPINESEVSIMKILEQESLVSQLL